MGHELKDLETMNSLGVLLKGTILGRELKAHNGMNSSGLQMTCTTLNH